MELTEAQMYDLQARGSSTNSMIFQLQRQMILHLRVEHGMALHEIARRMSLSMRQVKQILSDR
jgi:DNA-binding NarL/FixJ family response regulator